MNNLKKIKGFGALVFIGLHANLELSNVYEETSNIYSSNEQPILNLVLNLQCVIFFHSILGQTMEAKHLVVFFLVSCVFLSICLQPVFSQGLRWGREFKEEHPKIERVKSDYLRRKQMERQLDDSMEKGKIFFFSSLQSELFVKCLAFSM